MAVDRGAAIAPRGGRLTGPGLLVSIRVGSWAIGQLLVAAVLVLGMEIPLARGFEQAASWWMVYGTAVDLVTLATLLALLNREGLRLASLLGARNGVRRTALLGLGAFVATVPAVALTALVSALWYPDSGQPLFQFGGLPIWAALHGVLIWPLVAEVTEALVFFGYLLPRLAARLGSAWMASVAVALIWALSASVYPILLSDGGIDLSFAAYRAASVLPVVAAWTALYHALGRRLVPLIIAMWLLNVGTALAAVLNLMG